MRRICEPAAYADPRPDRLTNVLVAALLASCGAPHNPALSSYESLEIGADMPDSQGTPGATRTSDDELVKVIMNLPRSALAKVKRLAAAHGLNNTAVIRRGIDLEDFFDRVVFRGGTILVKERGCDDLKEVIFR